MRDDIQMLEMSKENEIAQSKQMMLKYSLQKLVQPNLT
jgi:hypothetical protein